MEVTECLESLSNIFEKGGPVKSDYNELRQIAIGLKDMSLEEESSLYELLKPVLNMDSVIGHTFLKPFGYAGDYWLIDKIYNKQVSDDPLLRKWDIYFHDADSSTAVRNRKAYFLEQIKKVEARVKNPLVLNLGSGPCSDVYEHFSSNPNTGVNFDCLDMDKSAIEYGESVCDNYYKSINFINKNAFRYKPKNKYNLIWSAGLFDYFSDKLFIRLTNRMYDSLEDGGELIIGNFSTINPGREEMEVYGKWYLNHRREDELRRCALLAGISDNKISVESEKTGVNLFLHLKK